MNEQEQLMTLYVESYICILKLANLLLKQMILCYFLNNMLSEDQKQKLRELYPWSSEKNLERLYKYLQVKWKNK